MLLLKAIVLTALIVWVLLMLAVILAALWPFTVPPPAELDYTGGPWDPDTWPLSDEKLKKADDARQV